jgi:hypothetical protein
MPKSMLEDKHHGIVYVPVSVEIMSELREWSRPLRVRIEPGYDGPTMVFKYLDDAELADTVRRELLKASQRNPSLGLSL